jgi:hypothetical protein
LRRFSPSWLWSVAAVFAFLIAPCGSAFAADTGLPYFVHDVSLGGAIASPPTTLAPQSGSVPVTMTGFDLMFGSGLTGNSQAQAAFQMAANRWSAVLRNPVTIKVSVDYSSLGADILGQTNSTLLWGEYSEIRNPLAATAATHAPAEAALLSSLPTAGQFQAHIPAGFSLNGMAYITQANYLGLVGGSKRYGPDDGSITFSSNYAWDFDPTDGIDAGKFDFVGAATHEIGHILGFSSIVDYVDYYLGQGQTFDQVGPFPLDFYRFDSADLGSGFDFSTTARNFVPGGSHVFYSPDGIVPMSTGVNGGDGRQASHWADWMGLGIMDPTAAPGELLTLSDNDLEAMNLIGWNTPEPTTLLLVIVALPLAARRLRRKS